MEFPITKERLQTYKNSQLIDDAAAELSKICKAIEQTVLYNNTSTYVYRIPLIIKNSLIRSDETNVKLLNVFIEGLKGMFINCSVVIDPLETYIVISWG